VTAVITKVQKWGNSQGLRLSKELLSDADIEVGDAVDVSARDGVIVVTPVRRVRGGLDLGELVREIPADYGSEQIDWGPPSGREVW
jgi:antitoxin MazE